MEYLGLEKDDNMTRSISPEDRKDFARKQYDFLRKQGIEDRLYLRRIFKVAGPGQVQEAWDLAHCDDWEADPISKDLLYCILTTGISSGWSAERIAKILKEADFAVPDTTQPGRFFRILKGAREVLFPYSHEFTAEEIQELKSNL